MFISFPIQLTRNSEKGMLNLYVDNKFQENFEKVCCLPPTTTTTTTKKPTSTEVGSKKDRITPS